MALEQKLSLKLAQKLVMTPSLQQAIKLLQMTRLELEGVLAQELMENPVLEESDLPNEERTRDADAPEAPADAPEAAPEAEAQKDENPLSDIDLDAFFSDHAESWEGNGAASIYEEREGPPLENTLSREDDLYDNLLWQLHMMEVDPLVREIAELIIGNLDEDGFLAATIEEIQAMGADGYDDQTSPPPGAAALAAAAAEAASEDSKPKDSKPKNSKPKDSEAAADTGLASPEGELSAAGAESVWQTAAAEPSPALVAEQAEAATAEGVVGEGAATEAGEADGAEEDAPVELPEGSYPREVVVAALDLVRGLEPPGVACKDLPDSLLCQLDRLGEPEDSFARRLVAEHWDLFTRRKFEQIAKNFGIPLQKLKPAVDIIGSLETRPGRQFASEQAQYVEPDVHVVKVGGEYVVQLNDNGLPRLRVSGAYRRMLQGLSKAGSEEEAQQYIKEKMRSAFWLIKSLDQRQRTIYKVTESIVKQQRGFLDHGVDHLRPMVLRDVAEDIEMHESTVSRVVSNKYVHTPRGLLPMKFFFHSGIDREYGGDISSLTVKRKIKSLIQDEEPKKPLSDSELMRILKREGIQIARRTVAKYRDELGIPSSTERKRIF